MFEHQGIWLPDGEKHFPDWMTKNGEVVDGKGTYQIKKLREALKHVKQWRTAIDVGGHVGLWSMHLVRRFANVQAFEPVPEFRECFRKNCPMSDMYRSDVLLPYALGAGFGRVKMNYDPADSGGTHVGGAGDVEMVTLDSLFYMDVDFIKIDCEGYELPVVHGAKETIVRCKPTIIVEQKPHKLEANFGIKGAPAVEYLKTLGYTVAREMSGDYIMVVP